MLRQVHRAVPRAWTVLVLADRGLYARWLFRRITRRGWHPFLRINTGGTCRPKGQVRGVPLKTLVPRSEEHTSELQSPCNLVCRLLLEKKKQSLSNLTANKKKKKRNIYATANRK